jgi:2-polyprenyl-3-methyl-5-hydroxy-6-metoxy-1,4-benzoquinol methylase
MSSQAFAENAQVEERARQSHGSSEEAIYRMVQRSLSERNIKGRVLIDVGCGVGNLREFVSDHCARYIGVDVLRYEDFPADAEFIQANMDTGRAALPDACADVVVSVETIEHLENPRDFMRELARLTKPDGWIIVTTPNQLSFLSLLTLVIKKRFASFQDCDYPAHITALLEVDLRRIAEENGLQDVGIAYSLHGRITLTPYHYPKFLARIFPRLCSDNLLLIGRKQSG